MSVPKAWDLTLSPLVSKLRLGWYNVSNRDSFGSLLSRSTQR